MMGWCFHCFSIVSEGVLCQSPTAEAIPGRKFEHRTIPLQVREKDQTYQWRVQHENSGVRQRLVSGCRNSILRVQQPGSKHWAEERSSASSKLEARLAPRLDGAGLLADNLFRR